MTSWIGAATPSEEKGCQAPFSFYFDLIDRFWKNKARSPQPFHRLCTLARKQGATLLLIEDALADEGVIEELDALDVTLGTGGTAEAATISFFATPPATLFENTTNQQFVGSLTIVNYTSKSQKVLCSYIFEAVFRRPAVVDAFGSKPLLNNFVFSSHPIDVVVRGRTFATLGAYFCQQNFYTHRCAQANLRMTLNTLTPTKPFASAVKINNVAHVANPSHGLTIDQIKGCINLLSSSCEAFTIPCATMPWDQFATIASAFAESGILALIVFTTGQGTDQHVVTSCGYTINTDEWHPHGVYAYSGHSSAPFYTSALWTDHLIVHDDNFGPYYTLTLSNRALEMTPTVRASWIVALAPKGVKANPAVAQSLAAISVLLALQAMNGVERWFAFLKINSKLVHRVTLVTKKLYLEHLQTPTHDGSFLDEKELILFNSLPDLFWMVEFSTIELFTGNHAKLGEVIVDACRDNFLNPLDAVLSIRLPGLVGIPSGKPGDYVETVVGAKSHMPILRIIDHQAKW